MRAGRSRLAVIFLTVLIDLIGFGLILPILPYYSRAFEASGFAYGALVGVFSLMQFAATVVLGRLSDRLGRRPVLLGTIALAVAGHLIFAFAASYAMLFAARAMAGLAAGNISVAQAYIADVTTPAERSRSMGLIGAAFGLGFVLGPALGGFAVHWGGPHAAGLVAAGLCLVNLVSAWVILEESLETSHRATRPLLDAEHMRRGMTDAALRPPFLVFSIVPFAFAGYIVALPLWAEARFGWGERDLAAYFTLIGICAVVVQGWAFGKIQPYTNDRTLAMIGCLGMACGLAILPILPTSGWVYAAVIPYAVSNSLAAPALTGIISSLADPTEQGAMIGAAQSYSALGRFSGPLLFGWIYDGVGANEALLGAALVMGLGAVVAHAIRLPNV
ncbi:MAG: MFS transporter [Gemmatimonadales bacterium]